MVRFIIVSHNVETFYYYLSLYRKTAMPTLWESLEEPDILDTTEFEYLFSKDTTQEKRKPLSETYEKKTKAKKVFIASLSFLCGTV